MQVSVGHYPGWMALLWRVQAVWLQWQLVEELTHSFITTATTPLSFFCVPEIRHRGGFFWLVTAQQNLVSPTAHTAQKEKGIARQSTANSGRTFLTYWTTSYLGKIWRLCIAFQCFLSSALLFFVNANLANGFCWLRKQFKFCPVSEWQWSV